MSVGRADTEETTQWTGYHSSLCRPMHRICNSFRNKWLTSHPINYIKIGDFCRRLSSLSRQRVTTYRYCGENGWRPLQRGMISRDVNFNTLSGQHGGCQYMEKNSKTNRHISAPPKTTLYRPTLSWVSCLQTASRPHILVPLKCILHVCQPVCHWLHQTLTVRHPRLWCFSFISV